MSLKEWAEENGLSDVYSQYKQECEDIAEQCEAEGYPGNGENYELRVESLRKDYPELFGEED